jgi:hypothetical protein
MALRLQWGYGMVCRSNRAMSLRTKNAGRLSLVAGVLAVCGAAQAGELSATWCDFRATVQGAFDVGTDDPDFGFTTAHQTFDKYAVSWLCERKVSQALPNEEALCADRRMGVEDAGYKFVACFFNEGSSGPYVTALTLAESPGTALVEGRWVAAHSGFTLILTTYALTDDERLATFQSLADGVSFVGTNSN